MKKQSTTIISIILLIIIVIFALLNTTTAEVNLLGLHVRMPLVLLIFVCLLIGAAIIYLLSFSTHLKADKELKELKASKVSKDELKKYQKSIDQLQKENVSLQQQIKELEKQSLTTK
ncbi:DUF1049 domain-containing protein [Limosilactobacillus sp. STM2_1]|uniref:DUF1049 domain-containing protein n=1 Tax=Limosilactobacillus rudii TaxID=2759755 RepID=A0A7W3UJE9_9LACO|nr:lipopolysaccharide assembly protein LapA domain-containing protein [Limosilactobacillus rudii]MBB1078723.1 DUF1049 domain-containing protein [Limosilactobacillus rudii]MBB1096709.1 DUF1049 domain-containing protein [Limosilactobacillus rudii]MCD7135619.1 lipopolysaccharide assembly protein LapA domain-containing protein [Limosilactobacillus rudii]